MDQEIVQLILYCGHRVISNCMYIDKPHLHAAIAVQRNSSGAMALRCHGG